MRSNRRPARSAVQRAWAGVFVQREFRSWLWPMDTTSEDCLSEEQISLPRQQLLTPRRTPRAVAELARGALSFAPAQFHPPLTPPQTPRAIGSSACEALGFAPAQFRSWQRPLAAASEDCLSTGQNPRPFPAATPTVPSQRCGPSCSPSPRGNDGRTRGRGSQSARAQQSPGQSRPGRRSWRGCW